MGPFGSSHKLVLLKKVLASSEKPRSMVGPTESSQATVGVILVCLPTIAAVITLLDRLSAVVRLLCNRHVTTMCCGRRGNSTEDHVLTNCRRVSDGVEPWRRRDVSDTRHLYSLSVWELTCASSIVPTCRWLCSSQCTHSEQPEEIHTFFRQKGHYPGAENTFGSTALLQITREVAYLDKRAKWRCLVCRLPPTAAC